MQDFAAFTIVRDEALFLPLWLRYYSGVFGEENCTVLDDRSSDGSVDVAKAMFPNANYERFDASTRHHDTLWLLHTVMAKQADLLTRYKVVVFAEADEYLIVKPGSRYKDLHDVCIQFAADEREFIRADGWLTVQQPDEPGIVPVVGESLLKDRKQCWKMLHYDKVLISKTPLEWTEGFHCRIAAGNRALGDTIDHDVVLFHAFTADIDETIKRHGPRFNIHDKDGAAAWLKTWERNETKPTPDEWRKALVW